MEKHISYYIQINDENVVETDSKLIRVIMILILDKNYCQTIKSRASDRAVKKPSVV